MVHNDSDEQHPEGEIPEPEDGGDDTRTRGCLPWVIGLVALVIAWVWLGGQIWPCANPPESTRSLLERLDGASAYQVLSELDNQQDIARRFAGCDYERYVKHREALDRWFTWPIWGFLGLLAFGGVLAIRKDEGAKPEVPGEDD